MTTSTGPSRNRPYRPEPSDIIFLILTGLVLLLAAFTVGGLAAHPFAG